MARINVILLFAVCLFCGQASTLPVSDIHLRESIVFDDHLIDLILRVYGQDAVQFLKHIDRTFYEVTLNMNSVQTKLETLAQSSLASPALQTELRRIISTYVLPAKEDPAPIMDDLDKVLPVISISGGAALVVGDTRPTNDLSSIIQSILKKTLDQFLRSIHTTFNVVTSNVSNLRRELSTLEVLFPTAATKIMEVRVQQVTPTWSAVSTFKQYLDQIYAAKLTAKSEYH